MSDEEEQSTQDEKDGDAPGGKACKATPQQVLTTTYMSIGIGMGSAIGAGVGVAMGSVGLGMGIGVAIGVALGAAMAGVVNARKDGK